MNDIDEFFEVALAIFLGISALLLLLTYLERSLLEPVKEKAAQIISAGSFPRQTRFRTEVVAQAKSVLMTSNVHQLNKILGLLDCAIV